MRNLLLTASLLAGIGLTGCANMDEGSGPTAADDPTIQCLMALADSGKYQSLYLKIGKNSKATIEQLASKERATDSDKALISSWASDRAACVDLGRDFRAAHAPPGYTMVFQHQQSALIRLAARLYAAEITYGQFNQERHKLSAETEMAMDRVRRDHMADLDRQYRNDLLSQQLMVDQMRRAFMPSPSMGTGINCTSRNIGGTVYTDCR